MTQLASVTDRATYNHYVPPVGAINVDSSLASHGVRGGDDELGAPTTAALESEECGRCSGPLFPVYLRKPRMIRNRGALLILFMSMAVDSGQSSVLNTIFMMLLEKTFPARPVVRYIVFFVAGVAVPQLLYPLAGWIADARVGRFRVIRFSLWCMGLSQCLLSVVLLLHILLPTDTAKRLYMDEAIVTVLFPLTFAVANVGLAGFQANAMQFGIDQMVDSSTDEVCAFVHWYYWGNYFGGGTLYMVLGPFLKEYALSTLLAGVNVLLMGVALLSWYRLHDWLIIDPRGKNPFRTVYDVVRFSSRHSAPIYRSALTYWDDRPFSRLDLGKAKYTGPFSTEEVEDVKSFFAITAVLAALGVYVIADNSVSQLLTQQMKKDNTSFKNRNSFWPYAVSTDGLIFVTIPAYELVVYPFVKNCLTRITILKRIGFGLATAVVSQIAFLALYEISFKTDLSSESNYCFLLNSSPYQNASIDAAFIAVPFAFSTFAELLVYIAALEFICAQSPYRFKGMLIGTFYAIQGLFTPAASLIAFTVASAYGDHQWKYGCGTAYYSVMVVIAAIGLFLFLLVGKRYKPRERDEHIDHHAIVENYYSKFTSNSLKTNLLK